MFISPSQTVWVKMGAVLDRGCDFGTKLVDAEIITPDLTAYKDVRPLELAQRWIQTSGAFQNFGFEG